VIPRTATAPDTTSNTVTVTTADNIDGEDDTSVEVTINPTPNVSDLAIQKQISATEVTVGNEFSYTLTVTSNGPDTAILVVVTDTLSDGVPIPAAPSPGSVVGIGAGAARVCSGSALRGFYSKPSAKMALGTVQPEPLAISCDCSRKPSASISVAPP
jgi:uncharacterized repeat protein (TIGR01451 family)